MLGTIEELLVETAPMRALGLLHPRFFPMWDTAITDAYIGFMVGWGLAPSQPPRQASGLAS